MTLEDKKSFRNLLKTYEIDMPINYRAAYNKSTYLEDQLSNFISFNKLSHIRYANIIKGIQGSIHNIK